MRSNQNSFSTSHEAKNYQKLDYDLWHHATLASYFKALSKHTTKLPIAFVRLCDHNFNVDSNSFGKLIELLDNIPVQLKRSLTDQLNFKLTEFDDETLRLTFTSSLGYYLQTLLTLGSEDEITQNVSTLLRLRSSILDLANSQNGSQDDSNEFKAVLDDESDDIETIDPNTSETDKSDISPYTVSNKDVPEDQRFNDTSEFPEVESTPDDMSDNEPTTETVEPDELDISNDSSEEITDDQNNGTQSSEGSETNTQEPLDVGEPSDSPTLQPEDPVTSDDVDDEFADMYDDDEHTDIQDVEPDQSDTNQELLETVKNNDAGEIMDDSPLDFHDTLKQISEAIKPAKSTETDDKDPLDDFYRQQDKALADKLKSVN